MDTLLIIVAASFLLMVATNYHGLSIIGCIMIYEAFREHNWIPAPELFSLLFLVIGTLMFFLNTRDKKAWREANPEKYAKNLDCLKYFRENPGYTLAESKKYEANQHYNPATGEVTQRSE